MATSSLLVHCLLLEIELELRQCSSVLVEVLDDGPSLLFAMSSFMVKVVEDTCEESRGRRPGRSMYGKGTSDPL